MLVKQMFSNRRPRLAAIVTIAASVAGIAAIVPMVRADNNAKPTIKEIMKADHKGDNSIAKHVTAGKATPDEISKLLADYKVMVDEDPPIGSKDDWNDRMKKLIAATEAVQAGDQDAVAQFKAAVSCKACHELHKEKK